MKISHALMYLVAGVTALTVAIFATQPIATFAVGHAGAAEAVAHAPPPDRTATSGVAQEQPFDYFPDHYVNQAKQPAEPIEQF